MTTTIVRWNMCSTWKRCTSTRWIHSDYPFWVSFGVTFNFVWKQFDWVLSNLSHTVRRLKFSLVSSLATLFPQLLCCKFFILVVIGKLVFMHNHDSFHYVLYTKKMHLDEMNPFWLSVLSFVGCTSSIWFESVLNKFVKFIAHGPSFKISFHE
jgi:hypothetical protein